MKNLIMVFLLISLSFASCKTQLDDVQLRIDSYKQINGVDAPNSLYKERLDIMMNCVDKNKTQITTPINTTEGNSTYIPGDPIGNALRQGDVGGLFASIVPVIIVTIIMGVVLSFSTKFFT